MQSYSQDLRDRVLWALIAANVRRRLRGGWKSVASGFTRCGSGCKRPDNAPVSDRRPSPFADRGEGIRAACLDRTRAGSQLGRVR